MKKVCFLLFTLFCMVFFGNLSNLTYAFLSDQDPRSNTLGVGYNDSTIEENFPTPSPVIPGKEQTFTKSVTVKNTQSVPCYIRVSVGVSESAVEDHLTYVNLNTSDWVFLSTSQNAKLGGYYYYKTPVSPGASTTALFSGVKLDASTDLSWYDNGDTFQVLIYEESVQSAGSSDYQSAWDQFLRE